MSHPPPKNGPDLRSLFAPFPPGDVAEFEHVAADEVPEPYHGLLVHEHHMTVTVEAFYGGPVNVRVLERKLTGDSYIRQILLTVRHTGKVVLFGIPRVNFQYCSPQVRAEIESEATPLGRVLINHNVLRRIETTAFLRVIPGRMMLEWFGLTEPTPTYGRLAYIHCDEQPAIELLEVVPPAP